MSLSLRLRINAGWPGQDPACDWALVNAQGALLQRGRSEPRHWPEADRCELILGAAECLLLKVRLPKGARSRPAEVIAYALEDQLIGDAEAEHFVIGEEDRQGTGDGIVVTPVWVIARARLKALLAILEAVGRLPALVISELQLVPLAADGWSVCLHGDDATGYLRRGVEDGCAFDLYDVAHPPVELRLALQGARKAGNAPQVIEVHNARGKAGEFAATTAAAWQQDLNVPVRVAGEFNWHQSATANARNLLSGEFAPKRAPNAGWGSLKPALLLGLSALLIYASFSFGEWIWLAGQSDRLHQQMIDSFRAAYPQAQNIVDPPLQMQRLNDQLRRERGQLGSTDFLPLLAAASDARAGQGKLRSLSFEDGRLELGLLLPDASAAQRLREILTSRGLTVLLRDTRESSGGVEAVFVLRSSQ